MHNTRHNTFINCIKEEKKEKCLIIVYIINLYKKKNAKKRKIFKKKNQTQKKVFLIKKKMKNQFLYLEDYDEIIN